MTIETESDRAFFLEEFGVPCRHSGSNEFLALFDNEYAEVLEVETRSPSILARTSDVQYIAEDDTVTVNGTDYTAKTHMPDGEGFTRLILESI